MFLIEEENAISEYYQQKIDNEILGPYFPWFWQIKSTSEKFPFFAHTLVPRYNEHDPQLNPTQNSSYLPLFQDIFECFCLRNNIKVNKILRGALNFMIPYANYPHTDPHVDHAIPHYGMLMYLNKWTNGQTILYKEKTDGKVLEHDLIEVNTTLTPQYEIQPKKGKIVVFDGSHFHAHRFCLEGERRLVCVFTFTVNV